MTNTWFQKFVDQVGPYLRTMPSPPHRSFSETVARTLWAIERIEQRQNRRNEQRRIKDGSDSLEF